MRRLDLPLRRRLEGRLSGERRTSAIGEGTELARVRPYVPGDDVRRLDWNAFARTREPHVRVHVAELAATTWLVLDASASMAFGTGDRRKWDVAVGVGHVVGQIATRRGGRMGVLRCGERLDLLAPRQGRGGVLGLRHAVRDAPPLDASDGAPLGDTLLRLRRIARTRASVVVISDWRGDRTWEAPLRALAARHEVFCVEIRDPREDELVDVGDAWFVDPETGRQLRVDTGSARLRERFAEAAAQERVAVAEAIRSGRAAHVVLSTQGDWLRELARYLDRQERSR